jgi:hypothetical protein
MLTEHKKPVGRHFKKQNAQCPSFEKAAVIFLVIPSSRYQGPKNKN